MTINYAASPILRRLAAGWRAVIDSNMIQAPSLETFLTSDPRNRAIVPVEIWFELYKQGSTNALQRGLEIMSRHSDQILVLRSTGEIMRFTPPFTDMAGRMILPGGGEEVRKMGEELSSDVLIDPAFAEKISAGWRAATEQNLGMLEGAVDVVAALPMMQDDMFSAHEIGVIRRNERFTHSMFETIFGAAEQINEGLSELMELPVHADHRIRAHSLQLRMALGIVIHHLWWIRNGSQSKKKLEATRNDVIDLLLAAQATFFDDFMTQDKKADWVYHNLKGALGLYVQSEFV